MDSSAFYVLGYSGVAALYLVLAGLNWRALRGEDNQRLVGWYRGLMPLIAVAHLLLLAHAVSGTGGFRFGFAHALSATLLLAVVICWVEGFFVPMRGLDLLVLPAAAVCVPLPAIFHGAAVSAAADTMELRVHLIMAISAYSLLTIAALHALLMASIDRRLHSVGSQDPGSSRWLARMPPLLSMERLLFRLITIGFVLLTLTLASGLIFSEELFGRAVRWRDHKTVFTIASWFVFACLLAGRFVFGWRGRKALRWTLAGFVMLLLAYVGSRFVYEVILRRF